MSRAGVIDAGTVGSALTQGQKQAALAAGFLGWMFAGMELSMFVLAGRAALVDLVGAGKEKAVGQWFTWYQGAVMLGAATGGWVFGWLGDRFGRTRAMGWSILCYSMATGGSYFVRGPWELLGLRFVTGMGIGGVWPNAVSLVAEAWPRASRPVLAGLLGTAANFGFVLLGAIGYLWPMTASSWRWVTIVGAAPVVLAVWVLMGVSESPKWVMEKMKSEEGGVKVGRGGTIAEIFRRPLLGRTIVGILLGAIPTIGTSANGNWLVFWSDHASEVKNAEAGVQVKAAADPRKKAVTQMQRSGGGIVGSLLGGVVAAVVGRRLTYFLISLFAFALSSYIFGMLEPGHAHFGWFTFALGLVGVTYFGWLPLFLPELFPTEVRSTGTGVSFNSGRVVAALVVLGASGLIAAFDGDYARVGLWTGGIYALGMVIIWFAPRTKEMEPQMHTDAHAHR